jgi:murein DD-endopeptidase MepM/ murein hydrolase activator NlpD
MKVIVFARNDGRPISIRPDRAGFFVPMALLFGALVFGSVYLGYRFGNVTQAVPEEFSALSELQARIVEQKSELSRLKDQSQAHLDALALRLGQIQSGMLRIEALGQRLADMANLDQDEFNFDQPPAQGGPAEATETARFVRPELQAALDEFQSQLDDRQRQLEVLERLVMNKELKAQLSPAGQPITKGWISSYYGKRADPFTGHNEIHKGMDFAGAKGSDITATAAGVVSWAGPRSGYGNLIEINHGNGYSTRYGHCETLLVQVGDKVEPGQKIALMGSTGRSTGPHVHYEVLKNGHQINPKRFIQASR